MKGILAFIILFLALNLSHGQINISKVQSDYEKSIERKTYGRNEKAGKYYDIRGFKMYCEVYGKGEPLLLIHGNGGSINNFVYQIPYLSKRYKVIIADSRAQGKSADKSDSLTYEMMADDYAALLSAMHIDSAYVVGWSDGGINGLLLAIRHPEKVKKLVITGANLQPDSSAVQTDVLQRVTKSYKHFVEMFNEGRHKTALDSAVFKYKKLMSEQPHIALKDLQKITVPTLVIGGDHDVIRPEHEVLIFKNIPNAYLWILPNSGHSTPVVYAKEFNQKIVEFLKTKYRKIEDRDREF